MSSFTSSDLLAFQIFSSLSQDEANLMTQRVLQTDHENDQTLTLEGDWGESLFLIRTGIAKVRSFTENGEERVFCILGAGEVFGEMALIDGQSRSADVVALTPVTLVKLAGNPVLKSLNSNPSFALEIAKLEAARLRDLNRRFALQGEDATTRLLDTLAYLSRKHAPDLKDALSVPEMAQQELANLAGLSRETTSRILSKLRERGVIVRKNGCLHVVDLQPLIKRGLID
tara:strand:- start:1388 stop:2074 length:687 start_codon:yes stop_codon:yes gene_type:complete